MVLQDSAVFNRHERKAGARNHIICRHVFDKEAKRGDSAGGAVLA
jgi:hypothetical protein